jgi:hypothetical protein
MNKFLLFVAAVLVIGSSSSCTKGSTDNGPFSCYCSYSLVTGTYYRDTTTVTAYATYVDRAAADNYCGNQQNALKISAANYNVSCYVK